MNNKKWCIVFLCIAGIAAIIFCFINSADEAAKSEESLFQPLYEVTDYFVKELDTYIESYGTSERGTYTEDLCFYVRPLGRLVIVEINRPMYSKVLNYRYTTEELVEEIKKHYSNYSLVNDVFVNGDYNITIDCRHEY